MIKPILGMFYLSLNTFLTPISNSYAIPNLLKNFQNYCTYRLHSLAMQKALTVNNTMDGTLSQLFQSPRLKDLTIHQFQIEIELKFHKITEPVLGMFVLI